MGAYIVRRLLQSLIVILGVIVITFIISRVIGDPVALLLPPEASPEQRAYLTKDLGLDRPLYIQLVVYVAKVMKGDFGHSFRHQESAMKLVFERASRESLSFFRRRSIGDRCCYSTGNYLSHQKRDDLRPDRDDDCPLWSVDPCFLGRDYVDSYLCCSVALAAAIWLWRRFVKYVILPAMTLAFFVSAATARLTRSNVLDVLDMDYVRYARLKGVPEFVVITRHVLRNAFITIFNIVALQLGLVIGGAVITEFIFSWPGIGRLSLESIYSRDYPVIQATVVVAAFDFCGNQFARRYRLHRHRPKSQKALELGVLEKC